MIGRLARYLTAVLLIAALIHVIAILLIPDNAPHAAFERLVAHAPAGRVTVFDRLAPPVGQLDPAFANAVCRLSDDGGGLRLSGTMPDGYWSIAVIADTGRIVSAVTRDDQDGNTIDLEVLAAGAATDPPPSGGADVVTLPADAGLVLIRAFVPAPGDRPAIEASLSALACRPVETR